MVKINEPENVGIILNVETAVDKFVYKMLIKANIQEQRGFYSNKTNVVCRACNFWCKACF